jgi:hypothetical protein
MKEISKEEMKINGENSVSAKLNVANGMKYENRKAINGCVML